MTVKKFTAYNVQPTIEITGFVLTGVSAIVVAVRFYCRIWVVGRLQVYDYIMLVALLCTGGLCACIHYQLMFGSGSQDASRTPPKINTNGPGNLSPEEINKLNKYLDFGSAVSWYAYNLGYLAIMGLIKLSILTLYLSFATLRTFRVLVHISIAIVAAISVLNISIIAFQCPRNPSFAVSPDIREDWTAGHCIDLMLVYLWQAGFNIGSDLFILLLPMPLLLSLRLNAIQRISLTAVFSVGLLVPIASGVRLWGLYLWTHSGGWTLSSGGSYVLLWTQVEINTAIICASAPSFQPLLSRILGAFCRSRRPREANYYYGGRDPVTGPPVARAARSASQDSVSAPTSPARIYCPPEIWMQDELNTEVFMAKRPTDEQENRERRPVFKSQSSVYSQDASLLYSTPTSPTRLNTVPTSGWI